MITQIKRSRFNFLYLCELYLSFDLKCVKRQAGLLLETLFSMVYLFRF